MFSVSSFSVSRVAGDESVTTLASAMQMVANQCLGFTRTHISLKFSLWRKGEFNFSTTCAAVSQSDHRIKRLW